MSAQPTISAEREHYERLYSHSERHVMNDPQGAHARTIASKSSESSVEKDGSVDFGEDTILGRSVDFKGPSLLTNIDQQRAFDGSSEAEAGCRRLPG